MQGMPGMPGGSYNIQSQIRENSLEIQDFLKEVGDWTSSIKRKDQALKEGKQIGETPVAVEPPAPKVRGRASPGSVRVPPVVAKPPTRKPAPTEPSQHAGGHTYDYFKDKWDKFDVEQALADVDEPVGVGADHSGPAMHPALAAAKRKHLTASPSKNPVAIAAEAEEEKKKGNEFFNESNFGEAVQAYSRSAALLPTCVAFANRAMAQLKLGNNAEAESDCTAALEFDRCYAKAFVRRATARRNLGRYLEASEDFESALRLEPMNKTFCEERRACIALLEAEAKIVFSQLPKVDLVVVERSSTEATAQMSGSMEDLPPLASPQLSANSAAASLLAREQAHLASLMGVTPPG